MPASGELLRDLDVVASVGDAQALLTTVGWRASRNGARLIAVYAFDTAVLANSSVIYGNGGMRPALRYRSAWGGW